jgi:8-oxo-dGTP pyrophosphatase MutT (NUDIX family)
MTAENFVNKSPVCREPVRNVVRSVIVVEGVYTGAIIIGKRASGEREGGKWCLPGGGVCGEDESLVAACEREIEEELGVCWKEVSIDDLSVFCETTRYKGRTTWVTHYFIAEVDILKLPDMLERFSKSEFLEIQAVESLEEIRGLRFAFGDGRVVRDFFKYVGN